MSYSASLKILRVKFSSFCELSEAHTEHNTERFQNRRRLNTEEKAQVIAAVWGTEFSQFLVALAILHLDDFKE